MEPLRPNLQRAKTAIIFAYIGIAVDLISTFSAYLEYNLLNTVAKGGNVLIEEAASNDIRQMYIGF